MYYIYIHIYIYTYIYIYIYIYMITPPPPISPTGFLAFVISDNVKSDIRKARNSEFEVVAPKSRT